jgi:RNA-binding protein 26
MVKRSLDNRPTKVMIKDIPQETNQDDLKKYFEQFGQVVSFEDAQDGAIAHYSQRFEAEKVKRKALIDQPHVT